MPVSFQVEAKKAIASAFVLKTIADRKLVGVLGDYLRDLHMRNPTEAEQFAMSLPTIAPNGSVVPAAQGLAREASTLSDVDKEVCRLMGVSPKDLVAFRLDEQEKARGYGLAKDELAICAQMGHDPKAFAAHKQARLAGPQDYGLTKDELAICAQMGHDPKAFAAHKQARLAGPQDYGLTKDELAICAQMGHDPKAFAAHKQARLAGPQDYGLTKDELTICAQMGNDPNVFAAHKQARLAGTEDHRLSAIDLFVSRHMVGHDPKQFADLTRRLREMSPVEKRAEALREMRERLKKGVLTPQELAICEVMRIKPEDYLAHLRTMLELGDTPPPRRHGVQV